MALAMSPAALTSASMNGRITRDSMLLLPGQVRRKAGPIARTSHYLWHGRRNSLLIVQVRRAIQLSTRMCDAEGHPQGVPLPAQRSVGAGARSAGPVPGLVGALPGDRPTRGQL